MTPRLTLNVAASKTQKAPPASRATRPSAEKAQHAVRFFTEDTPLIETLAPFAATALEAGNSVVIFATPPHRHAVAERLESLGFDVPSLTRHGRYLALDAAEKLAKFMVDDWPSASRFAEVMGPVIERAAASAEADLPRVFAFGEMVALLWEQGKIEATIRLEQLWNELAEAHSFSLCCAYPMGTFNRRFHGEPFLKICAEHSQVLPGHSYLGLLSEDDRLRTIALLEQKTHALEAEAALRRSEERFELLVESVQDCAIFMLDTGGRVTTWNAGAQRIKGYAASEIVGQHFRCFYPQEDIDSRKPERGLETAAAVGRFEDEGWRIRRDGSRFWANVIISAMHDEAGRLCGFSKITRDFTERMQVHETLKETNQHLGAEIAERIIAERKLHHSERSLRNLSAQLLRAQDEERRRFGRELHDSVGQCLAVLKMGLDSLRADAGPNRAETDRQLAECVALAEQAIREVRTISYLLHPPMLEELGLNTAIPWYLDGFAKRSGIRTSLDMPHDFARLPRDVELAIFRVLQESLTNVHRHSGSSTAHASLAIRDGVVSLEVHDDGKGIPPSILEMGPDSLGNLGVGLRGMNERMRELGGTLELISAADGTTVRATVPYKPPVAASASDAVF
jgi:PAS domain S-box-containing protein